MSETKAEAKKAIKINFKMCMKRTANFGPIAIFSSQEALSHCILASA